MNQREKELLALEEKVSQRELIVDGTDKSGLFAGDGDYPPFVVFDADAQDNIAGPFSTRDKAEQHRQEILCGMPPRLDTMALKTWIETLDTD